MISRQRIGLLLLASLATGLLAGTILLFDETRPETFTRHGVTIGIEKTRFRKGENMTWWVKNNRNNPIYVSDVPDIEQKVDGEWKIAFTPAFDTLLVLPSKEVKTYTFRAGMDSGLYRVVFFVEVSYKPLLAFSPFLCFEIVDG